MKIKKIKIQNYKNLNIDFGHNSDIITIIGNNGSGKSNLLESISLIFRSLYVSRNDVQFNYFIEYLTSDGKKVEIQKTGHTLALRLDGKLVLDITPYLPKNIIAIYSGEESRLFDKCYGPFYLEFVRGINSAQAQGTTLYSSLPKMLFLNKFYWDLSLLCFLLSDLPDNIKFVNDVLKINQVDKVTFKFNKANYVKYNDNQALELVKYIDTKIEYDLTELKVKLNARYDIVDVFKYLYLAFTPKDAKIISEINITFNNGLIVSDLSEGEKKLLLIKAAMEFASNEDSLYILDEPDAHIHINNKEQIIKSIEDYKANRQIIITTHSPTLTQCLNNENVYMLSHGLVEDKSKQEIINEIANEFWNKQEQNVFLSSNKPIILFVEGEFDKKHINYAFSLLKDEYPNLDFDVFNMNSACNIPQMMTGLRTNDVDYNKLFIGVFDDDETGNAQCSLTTCQFPNNQNLKRHKEGYYAIKYPKHTNHRSKDFTVENFFETHVIEKAYKEAIDYNTGRLFGKSLDTFNEKVKDKAKSLICEYSKIEIDKEYFKNFRLLFNEIELIRQDFITHNSQQ